MLSFELTAMIRDNGRQLEELTKKVSLLTASQPEYLSLKEVSKLTKMSQSTLKRYKSEIGFFQRDKTILIKRSDLDRWISNYYHKSTIQP